MKKILGLSLLIVSINSFGQNIPGYQTRQVREKLIAMSVDSGLHIPRYNGTPTGIRNGVYVADGAVAMDTTNNRLYIFSGGVWNRIVNISDTSVAFNPSLTTNLRLQKIIDSLNAAGWATGGITALGAIGSSPNANGATITGSTLNLEPASVSFGGVVTTGAQTFNGAKTLNSHLTVDGTFFSYALTSSSSIQSSIYSAGSTNTLHHKVALEGNTSPFSAVFNNNDFSTVGIKGTNTFTEGTSGTHNLVSQLNIQPLQLNNGSATTTNAATVYVRGSTIGTAGITNNYSMWIDSGIVRVDEIIIKGANTDTVAYLSDVRAGGGGGGSNFANADLTFTGNRFHELDDNQLEIANQGGNQLLIDPVNRRYGLGDIPATGNGRSLIILDTATVTDGYKMPAMQEATTSKVVYYNTTTGGLTYDDAPTGTGTVTDFAFTDGNGFDGTVTNSTTTPTLALTIDHGFQDWYQIQDELRQDDRVGFDWISAGTGSSAVSLTTGNIPNGYMFGVNMSTGTTNSGSAFLYTPNTPAGAYMPISINSGTRANVGFKLQVEDLSDGTDTYSVHAGFIDNNTVGTASDGVYFRYTSTDSSGVWIMCTKAGGTTTEDASSTTVVADTDYRLEITVIGTVASFYINGTLAGTIGTNVPSGAAQSTSIACGIVKTAGTTNRDLKIDWGKYGTRTN